MFTVEQLVVYPAQGVGVIERIENKDIGGSLLDFYVVRILESNITLMVPVTNASNVGLRNLCSKTECQETLEILQDHSNFSGYTGQNWNRRYRDYSEKMQSGDIVKVASVLRELLLISKEKELSFGERRLLEQAMQLVSMEIAHVLNQKPENIRTEITAFFTPAPEETESSEQEAN